MANISFGITVRVNGEPKSGLEIRLVPLNGIWGEGIILTEIGFTGYYYYYAVPEGHYEVWADESDTGFRKQVGKIQNDGLADDAVEDNNIKDGEVTDAKLTQAIQDKLDMLD